MGTRRITAWLILAFGPWLPAIACGQALSPLPQGTQEPPLPAAAEEAAPPGATVCPECGQPCQPPPPGWLDTQAVTAPFCNWFRHPPWESAIANPLEPLWRESWLYRPYTAGIFLGAAQGSTLVDDWIGMNMGISGGLRLGMELNKYWGVETRFSWNTGQLWDSEQAKEFRAEADTAAGLSPSDPQRTYFENPRYADMFFWDLDMLYYPWGDFPRPAINGGHTLWPALERRKSNTPT